ncbi:MAG: hypothetical protein AAFX87_22710 [Bacteroidota bacterium]
MNLKGEKLLRTTLKANATFSTITCLLIIFFDEQIQSLMNVNGSLVPIAISLVPFAVLVFYVATRPDINRTLVKAIISMDVLWVIGSIILLVSDNGMTVLGNWIVGIVAIFVFDFAFFQYRGLKGMISETKTSEQLEAA